MCVDGVLVVDKPAGCTSHDVVQHVSRVLRRRVGHTGTLDPLATGVLPLLVGAATRLSRYFARNDKEYLAEIRLGSSTETFDSEGRLTDQHPVPEISAAQVERTLDAFRGRITQQVPAYSAVRVAGERLYRRARRGQTVVRPSREVEIFRLVLLEQRAELWRLQVHCSAGTYVRSLAHDIGQALGCGAHLESLRRIRSGHFDLSRALPLEAVPARWNSHLYSLEELLPDLPRLDLEQEEETRVRHGNRVISPRRDLKGRVRLFGGGRLLAVAEVREGWLQPLTVLRGPSRREEPDRPD